MSKKSKINKQRTSAVAAERAGIDPFEMTVNRRRRGEHLSPADRGRGERSGAEQADVVDVSGG